MSRSVYAPAHERQRVAGRAAGVKRKFGDSVRSSTDTSMMNEALAKLVCHNLCCVIQEWHELGIDPTDWGMPARNKDEPSGPVAVLPFPARMACG